MKKNVSIVLYLTQCHVLWYHGHFIWDAMESQALDIVDTSGVARVRQL
jgi:hypothetical protein